MKRLFFLATLALGMAACSSDNEDNNTPTPTPEPETPADTVRTEDQLIVVLEGSYGQENSSLAYINAGTLTHDWYGAKNGGAQLGGLGNAIIQVNDTLLAIAMNGSGKVLFIHPDGTAVASTALPQARQLATDGSYVYCTSYADNGYVAKIDARTKQVVSTCATGHEPEGVAYAAGSLYVANTGAYSGYESTVSVVNAESMTETKKIDTGCLNLYGDLSVSGYYLCIGASGNYTDKPAQTVLLQWKSGEVKTYDFPASFNTAYNGKFYIIGSEFSYATYTSTITTHTIDATTLEASEGLGDYVAASDSVKQAMTEPYCLYASPYTGHLYVGDAKDYVSGSELREFGTDGAQLRKHTLQGLCPGDIVALK